MRKILINTLSQFVGRVIGALCAFLSTILLAKNLSVYSFGEYVKIATYVALFYPFVDFGLNTMYLKLQKQGRVETTIGSFLLLRLLLSLVLGVTAVVGAYFLSMARIVFVPSQLLILALGMLTLAGFGLSLTYNALFQARLRYDVVAIGLSLGSLVTLMLLFGAQQISLLVGEWGVTVGVGALVMGVIATGLWYFFCYPISPSLLFIDKKLWKELLVASFPLGVTLLFNIVYFKVDTLILSVFRPVAEVGVYGFAYKFFEFALVVPTFVMNSVYPILLKKPDVSQTALYLKKILQPLFIFSLMATIVLWVGAPFLVWVKQDFVASVVLLRILAVGLPLFFLTSPLMWWYVLIGKQKLLAVIYGLTMIFNICANLIFIPSQGAIGAAFITGATELVMLILGGSYLFYYYAKST